MLMLLAMQAAVVPQATGSAPVPPPIIRTYPAPVVVTPYSESSAGAMQVFDIDVVIRAPSGPLWQGTLRVADRGGESSWSQTRNEPARAACPLRDSYWNGEREMLSLTLSPVSRTSGSMTVQVRWARRGDGACDGLARWSCARR